MNKPNYGNWIPDPLLRALAGASLGLGAVWLAALFLLKSRIISAVTLLSLIHI